MSTKQLSDEIAKFRAQHKLDQLGFARGAGFSESFVQRVEKGRTNPSERAALKMKQFMENATRETIASLRGPGMGNNQSKARRGRKLTRHELDRVDLNRSSPDEIDEDLLNLLRF